jgi:2-phospho-L-lactate guanylyltransferase
MSTWAIIPVKHLRESKRRLEHLLSADERAGLIRYFLDNLLAVLNAAPGIDRVLVVTADPAVAALAARQGAEVLVEVAPAGLNAAVAQGVAHAAAAGAMAVLVLPADLPFARVEDIERMLRPQTTDHRPLTIDHRPLTADGRPPTTDHRPRGDSCRPTTDHWPLIALTGDEAEEGTNALLLAPPGDFTFHYGPGSFRAHLEEAEARHRATYVINAPGLRFDLDTESDWTVYNGYLVGAGEE